MERALIGDMVRLMDCRPGWVVEYTEFSWKKIKIHLVGQQRTIDRVGRFYAVFVDDNFCGIEEPKTGRPVRVKLISKRPTKSRQQEPEFEETSNGINPKPLSFQGGE